MTQQTTLTKAPFKADHVGSFLRPERLKQARLQKENGEITAMNYERLKTRKLEYSLKSKRKQAYICYRRRIQTRLVAFRLPCRFRWH